MSHPEPVAVQTPSSPQAWKQIIASFQEPSSRAATWQLVNSIGSYLALWVLMGFCATVSWWLVLPLMVLNGAMLVRVFIIFHDCGHGSFFASQRANDFWGNVTGVLTFTPYYHWRAEHAAHHGTTGNLDRRGVGDFWTMTVREYLAAPRWKRVTYRIARNPIVLLGVAPLVMFVVEQRIPKAGTNDRDRQSVWFTNLMLLLLTVAASSILGLGAFVVMQLGVLAIAGAIGIWLFYLQHQFEDAYWERGDDWDFFDAAIKGSAFLKLPRILQWFTGNIGFHHIHHLSSRIPNYRLQACHESHPMFGEVRPMTFLGAVRSFGLKLWDEASRKLIRFHQLKTLRARAAA